MPAVNGKPHARSIDLSDKIQRHRLSATGRRPGLPLVDANGNGIECVWPTMAANVGRQWSMRFRPSKRAAAIAAVVVPASSGVRAVPRCWMQAAAGGLLRPHHRVLCVDG